MNSDHKLLGHYPPFISGGIIRVGGRIKHSLLPPEVKHPVLIPRKHPLALLIARHYHSRVEHQGRHLTLGAIRQAGIHIENAKTVVKEMLAHCVICKRSRGTPCTQIMADLPTDRLAEVPPFTNTGVDLFGPYMVYDGATTRRTNANKKVYAVIFVCMVTRAVHLEPCPLLDTTSFRNALDRFLSIRGSCRRIRSDNGSNLKSVAKQIDSQNLDFDDIKSGMEKVGIEWVFNPPYASHFGGHYERKIGSIKRVLDASLQRLGTRNISRDEFHTLLHRCARIVNDTPLWPVSASPDDLVPLTPSTLLDLKSGHSDVSLETYTERDLLAYGRNRWRRIQFIVDEFWREWRTYYLHELQARSKWKLRKPSLQIGDIVIVKNKNESRNTWPLAIVDELIKSKDGLVRSVLLRTGRTGKTSRRAISDLILAVIAEDQKTTATE